MKLENCQEKCIESNGLYMLNQLDVFLNAFKISKSSTDINVFGEEPQLNWLKVF